MSGGSLNYFYCQLQDHIGDFDDVELDELVSDLADLFHAREWYLSSDTGIGSWRRERDKFKDKWFKGNRAGRLEKILNDKFEQIRDELGIKDNYCQSCKHWTQADDCQNYGKCEFDKGFLRDDKEYCDKWEGVG